MKHTYQLPSCSWLYWGFAACKKFYTSHFDFKVFLSAFKILIIDLIGFLSLWPKHFKHASQLCHHENLVGKKQLFQFIGLYTPSPVSLERWDKSSSTFSSKRNLGKLHLHQGRPISPDQDTKRVYFRDPQRSRNHSRLNIPNHQSSSLLLKQLFVCVQ